MKKKLKASGNGWELYFPKPLLKLLGYDPMNTKILITSKNKALILEPLSEDKFEKYKNNMVRNFQKSGGSYGIYFPETLIDILEINPAEDFIDIDIDESRVILRNCLNVNL